MAKLLLNADGKVLTSNDKVLKAPEVDTSSEDGLIDGSLTTYSNDRVTSIRNYAFYYSNLTEISLPNVTSVGNYAFYSCKSLTDVYAPLVTSVGNNAFQYCETLTKISLPKVTTLNKNTFSSCYRLIEVEFPNLTSIDGKSVFSSCKALTKVSVPNLVIIAGGTFSSCEALKQLYLPKLKSVEEQATSFCKNLIELLIPSVIEIKENAFASCYSLKKIYIEQTDSICTLKNVTAFTFCYHILGTVNSTYNPNGDKDGYIYVPASRLAEYKISTNWAEHSSQIIGHQDFNVGDTLPDYTTSDFTTQTWYSDETLTTVVTSVATAGKYYCRLEA